jgi:hypothetical protein
MTGKVNIIMKHQILNIATTLLLTSTAADCQLYLVSGTPTPNGSAQYAMRLLHVNMGTSKTELDTELIPSTRGVEWVGISYDWQRIVVQARGLDGPITVIDFNRAPATKVCTPPKAAGAELDIKRWLASIPRNGLFFQQHLAESDMKKDVVQSMNTEFTVSCNKSFSVVPPDQRQFIAAHGITGVGGQGGSDGVVEFVQGSGEIVFGFSGKLIRSGYEVPASMWDRGKSGSVGIMINDSSALAISLNSEPAGYKSWILRKKDNTWHALPVVNPSPTRGFGRFIAIAEATPKNSINSAAVGSGDWNKPERPTGPVKKTWFDEDEDTFSGRLLLYDVDADRTFVIATGQGDSEIVLVDGNIVYYRVSDGLYSVPITDAGIGLRHLLAMGPEILDVHWAFVKQ